MPRSRRTTRAADHFRVAQHYVTLAHRSAVAWSLLVLAHCEACQAMARANTQAERERAADLSNEIAEKLRRTPQPNPSMRRHPDLGTARRDADRRALRTKTTHYVYRVRDNPRYAVISADHPVQDNIEKGLIWAGPEQLAHTAEPPQENPLDPTQTPPTFAGGYPRDTTWKYRGREIRVWEHRPGDYRARYLDEEMIRQTAFGESQQEALANARYAIDLERMPEGFRQAETLVQHVLDHFVDYQSLPVTRANVSRYLERVRHAPPSAHGFGRSSPSRGDPRVPVEDEGFAAFDSLPLPERLRLIDEVIAYQKRAGMIDPERFPQKNPSKPRARKRAGPKSLRHLLRV